MEITELTKEGLEKIKAELKNLVEVVKPQVIEQLTVARSYGDLKENADYSAAREKQAEVESRIKELNYIIENHKIIENQKTSDSVGMGSVVTLEDGRKFKIIGSVEINPLGDMKEEVKSISNVSPLGSALMGKKVGEEVKVECKNPYTVKVKKIEGSK